MGSISKEDGIIPTPGLSNRPLKYSEKATQAYLQRPLHRWIWANEATCAVIPEGKEIFR